MFGFEKEFPVKRPYAPEYFGEMATASSFDTIIALDFARYHTFNHVVPTTSCVWVACSDLSSGTFSHIRSERSPAQYVRELSGVWKRDRPGVVLIGARSSGIEDSIGFAEELKRLLVLNNFRITGEDLGGGVGRSNFEMTRERVVATRSDGVGLEFTFT